MLKEITIFFIKVKKASNNCVSKLIQNVLLNCKETKDVDIILGIISNSFTVRTFVLQNRSIMSMNLSTEHALLTSIWFKMLFTHYGGFLTLIQYL